MEGKKYLQDACKKYNLDFDALFYFGYGTKYISEYNSEYGYKKSTIVQKISPNFSGSRTYVVKFMAKDDIYIAWKYIGKMTYTIFVKDVYAKEGEIIKIPHFKGNIGGEQSDILLFKADSINQFIGNYIIGSK